MCRSTLLKIIIGIIIILAILMLFYEITKLTKLTNKCNKGYFLSNGKCTICPINNYCPGNNKKINCEIGKVSMKGSFDKKNCKYILNNFLYDNVDHTTKTNIKISNPVVDQYIDNSVIKDIDDNLLLPEIAGDLTEEPDTENPSLICDPGYYDNNGICATCTIGSYCPGNNNKTGCPPHYTSLAGSSSFTNCTCEIGYYSSDSTCEQCPCITGYYITNNRCIFCPSGYYCPTIDSNPIKCMYNSSSNAGSHLVTDCVCLDGYYLNGSNKCEICPVGYYCSNNIKTKCLGDKTSVAGSSSINNCICDSGYYNDSENNCSICTNRYCPIGSTMSYACGENEESLVERATSSLLCSCILGYYGVHGNCTICPTGYYCPRRSTYPIICPINWTSDQGSYSCKCSPGYYRDFNANTCNICDTGNYCINDIKSPCDNNTVASSLGMSICITCSPGEISNNEKTKCLKKYYLKSTYSSRSGDVAGYNTSPGSDLSIDRTTIYRRAIYRPDSTFPDIINSDSNSQGFYISFNTNISARLTFKLTKCISFLNNGRNCNTDDSDMNGYLIIRNPVVIFRTEGSPNRLSLKENIADNVIVNNIYKTNGLLIGQSINFRNATYNGNDYRYSRLGTGASNLIKYIEFDFKYASENGLNGYNTLHIKFVQGAFDDIILDTYLYFDGIKNNLDGILRIYFYRDTPFDILANLNTNAITF